MNAMRCRFRRSPDGSEVGRAWQIAAAVILAGVLSGVSRPVCAQATGRLQVAATVVPATAAWEAQDGVKAFLQKRPASGVIQTALATIVSETPAVSSARPEPDPSRILTVNYLAN